MVMYLKNIGFFMLGILIGYVLFITIPHLPFSSENPVLSQTGIQKPKVIGFLPYFLLDRATKNYNPYVTTLTYFGLTIKNDGHIIKLANKQQEDPAWHDLNSSTIQNKLQAAKNNHETLSLTVVSGDEASISAMLNKPKTSAQNLLGDITPVMRKYGFADVNIDVESFLPADAKKVQEFTTFVQTIKNGINQQHLGTVTIDIAPISLVKQTIIDPVALGKTVDYVVLMAYDYHTVVSPNTGPIAPISGAGKEGEYDVVNAVAIAKQEINPQKIILGIPLYGYEWDSLSSEPGAATIPNTGQTASNRRMTTFLASCKTCTVINDKLSQEQIIGFQDKADDKYYRQVYLFDDKALNKRLSFANDNQLAGVALWALGYEGDSLLQPLSSYKRTYTLK